MDENVSVTISVDSANKLYEFAKNYCNVNKAYCSQIHCKLANSVVIATMLDGYKIAQIGLPAEDAESMEAEFLITPPAKKFTKKDVFVQIKAEKSQTTYNTALGSTILSKKDDTFPDINRIMTKSEDTVFKIGFMPENLSKALAPFIEKGVSTKVVMEFTGPKSGVWISGNGAKAMVLPVLL